MRPNPVATGYVGRITRNGLFGSTHTSVASLALNGAMKLYPDSVHNPGALAWGPDGNLWFGKAVSTGPCSQFARLTPTGRRTAFCHPNPFAQIISMTASPDGNLWFIWIDSRGNDLPTDPPNGVGRITPKGKVKLWPIFKGNQQPLQIVLGPDRNLWVTEDDYASDGAPSGGKLDRIKVP